jgi:predicted N-formylglutamate amidohydrolase
LGLSQAEIEDHIGWDIGAGAVTRGLSDALDTPAVLAGVSRLVIDCNRDLSDHDCIVEESHGVRIPGNLGLTADESARRVRDYYEPFHLAVDHLLRSWRPAFLLSVHSFTPVLGNHERKFDVGLLFDRFESDARRLGNLLADSGFAVRYNEPYSAHDGLIYSARVHGRRNGVRYLEIEVNNRLLREPSGVNAVTAALCRVLSRFQGERCGSS